MTDESATLPDELLRRALELVMLRDGEKQWSGAVRGVSRRWRALHDGACTRLRLRNGVTDEGMHALCGRLPGLKTLILNGVTSLTADGLRAVGGLTALTHLNLDGCNVTDRYMKATESLSGRESQPQTAAAATAGRTSRQHSRKHRQAPPTSNSSKPQRAAPASSSSRQHQQAPPASTSSKHLRQAATRAKLHRARNSPPPRPRSQDGTRSLGHHSANPTYSGYTSRQRSTPPEGRRETPTKRPTQKEPPRRAKVGLFLAMEGGGVVPG